VTMAKDETAYGQEKVAPEKAAEPPKWAMEKTVAEEEIVEARRATRE
jgi:hypothetical protein